MQSAHSVELYGIAISGNGRYIYYHDTSSYLRLLDTETGTSTSLGLISNISRIQSDTSGENLFFVSSDNISGLNSSGRLQIFQYNRVTGSFSRITNSQQAAEYIDFAVSSDGSTLAFASKTYYNANGTVQGSDGTRVFMQSVNLENDTFNLLFTNLPSATLTDIKISSSGKYITFSSSADITGDNAGLARRVFVAESSNIAGSVQQVGDSQVFGSGGISGINDNGELYFLSTSNFVGLNSSGRLALWKFNATVEVNSVNDAIGINGKAKFEKLTDAQSAVTFNHSTLSGDGTTVFFGVSGSFLNDDLTGLNSAQLYKFNTNSGLLERISELTSNDGQNIAMTMSGDLRFGVWRSGSTLRMASFVTQAQSFNFELGFGGAASISSQLGGLTSALEGISGYSITSQSSARGALDVLSKNIGLLANFQGGIGSTISRLETAGSVTSALELQTIAARSRITDVDMAAEVANLLRVKILQDSASSVLAQANQIPSLALTLLNSPTATLSGNQAG